MPSNELGDVLAHSLDLLDVDATRLPRRVASSSISRAITRARGGGARTAPDLVLSFCMGPTSRYRVSGSESRFVLPDCHTLTRALLYPAGPEREEALCG
jgi:hypothetical protein